MICYCTTCGAEWYVGGPDAEHDDPATVWPDTCSACAAAEEAEIEAAIQRDCEKGHEEKELICPFCHQPSPDSKWEMVDGLWVCPKCNARVG